MHVCVYLLCTWCGRKSSRLIGVCVRVCVCVYLLCTWWGRKSSRLISVCVCVCVYVCVYLLCTWCGRKSSRLISVRVCVCVCVHRIACFTAGGSSTSSVRRSIHRTVLILLQEFGTRNQFKLLLSTLVVLTMLLLFS